MSEDIGIVGNQTSFSMMESQIKRSGVTQSYVQMNGYTGWVMVFAFCNYQQTPVVNALVVGLDRIIHLFRNSSGVWSETALVGTLPT